MPIKIQPKIDKNKVLIRPFKLRHELYTTCTAKLIEQEQITSPKLKTIQKLQISLTHEDLIYQELHQTFLSEGIIELWDVSEYRLMNVSGEVQFTARYFLGRIIDWNENGTKDGIELLIMVETTSSGIEVIESLNGKMRIKFEGEKKQ